MNDIQLFYLLKEHVATRYREAYPYYTGKLAQFGNREIAQFIDLLEKDCNTRVSEKWVYTHLKPEVNEKLPRKDMLDILCQWLGYAGWDEFAHKNRNIPPETTTEVEVATKAKKHKLPLMVLLGSVSVLICVGLMAARHQQKLTVCYKDRYTQQEIPSSNITVYLADDSHKKKITANNHCYNITYTGGMLITESAYYKADTLKLSENNEATIEITLQPDDYAMMLRAYMNGDVADWNKRRTQLAGVIADDAVIQEVMFDDIGVEFLNKEEFINKVTVPGITNKNMEVIEVKYRDGKITSLKFMQKGK